MSFIIEQLWKSFSTAAFQFNWLCLYASGFAEQ